MRVNDLVLDINDSSQTPLKVLEIREAIGKAIVEHPGTIQEIQLPLSRLKLARHKITPTISMKEAQEMVYDSDLEIWCSHEGCIVKDGGRNGKIVAYIKEGGPIED